jgi:hypothetical protein
MSGFTKLVPEIIQSSIWNESAEVRCVWIAMLALKDQDGYVRGDPATLSRLANVSLEAVNQALKTFTGPDPLSHTPDNEGRRIEAIPGGWLVLNHELYRVGDRREYMRDYMRKRRAKGNDVNSVNVNVNNPSASASVSACAFAEGEPEGETRRSRAKLDLAIPPELDDPRFLEVWQEWIKHRSEIRKKLTPSASKKQLKKLAGWGLERAINAIEHSIAGGWQGIFEEGSGGGKRRYDVE